MNATNKTYQIVCFTLHTTNIMDISYITQISPLFYKISTHHADVAWLYYVFSYISHGETAQWYTKCREIDKKWTHGMNYFPWWNAVDPSWEKIIATITVTEVNENKIIRPLFIRCAGKITENYCPPVVVVHFPAISTRQFRRSMGIANLQKKSAPPLRTCDFLISLTAAVRPRVELTSDSIIRIDVSFLLRTRDTRSNEPRG